MKIRVQSADRSICVMCPMTSSILIGLLSILIMSSVEEEEKVEEVEEEEVALSTSSFLFSNWRIS